MFHYAGYIEFTALIFIKINFIYDNTCNIVRNKMELFLIIIGCIENKKLKFQTKVFL